MPTTRCGPAPAARRRRGRLAQPQDVRGDRRRGEVAGLDAARSRHQRQRQARRGLCRAEPAGRSDQGQAHHRRALRHRHQSGRRHGLGLGAGVPGLRRPRRTRAPIRPRRRWPKSTRPPMPGYGRRAAWTSTATASSGCRCERPPGELRPPQVQGPAQRPDRDRQALPGRLDALSVPRPAVRRT